MKGRITMKEEEDFPTVKTQQKATALKPKPVIAKQTTTMRSSSSVSHRRPKSTKTKKTSKTAKQKATARKKPARASTSGIVYHDPRKGLSSFLTRLH